jgi:ABC-type transport system involved in multi-copper enzyme maturation permease subunit
MKQVEARPAHPLFGRELAARMRARTTPVTISLFLALASGIAFMIYLIGVASGTRRAGSTSMSGFVLFYFLVLMQVVAACFITPAFAAGMISSERQRGTLTLLRAALIGGRQIVLSKLLVALLYALLFIFLSLPLYSFAFMLGGIETFELLMALAVVASSSILFVTFALFVSAGSRTTTLSTVWSYGFTILIVIGMPILLAVLVGVAQSSLVSVRFSGSTLLSNVVEGFFGVMVSLSPFTAIYFGRQYYENSGDYLFYRQPFLSASSGVTLPAPYLTLTIVYLLLSALFVVLAIRRAK